MINYLSVVDVLLDGLSGGDAKGIHGAILKGLRSLFYHINSFIYQFISILYNLFRGLSNARLLNQAEFSTLASRVGLVLGIIMLFRVLLEFIRILVDPDKMLDSQVGMISTLKRVLIVIVMLGFSSTFFETLYYVQNLIITNDVLYGFLLPRSDVTVNKDNFGNVLSARVFGAFYYVDERIMNTGDSEVIQCDDYRTMLLNDIVSEGDYTVGNFCLNAYGNYEIESISSDLFIMYYNFILQTLTGIVLVYLLVSYVIQVGIRVIQLTVLQVISPMAIVGYLSPKQDNMFQKWWKIYFATYIDVFIRVIIIYFVVYLSSVLLDTISTSGSVFSDSIGASQLGTFSRSLYTIAMILAMFAFAKKAPDLLKELFPVSASKLSFFESPKSLMKNELAPAAAALAPVGLLAKRTVGGIDSLAHGHGFMDGWGKQRTKFGSWLDKQRETLTPYGYKEYKDGITGREEVDIINKQWVTGANIAKKIMHRTNFTGVAGSGANGWDKAFNGVTRHNYEVVFKHKEFIDSKMNVDRESSVEDDLRRLQQRVNLEGATQAFSQGSVSINGKTYNDSNVSDLIKDLEDQTKKVEGLKKTHDSISKQYQDDAALEAAFKFTKNNATNPANPTVTRTSRGI